MRNSIALRLKQREEGLKNSKNSECGKYSNMEKMETKQRGCKRRNSTVMRTP